MVSICIKTHLAPAQEILGYLPKLTFCNIAYYPCNFILEGL
jgi:hypothetical protein